MACVRRLASVVAVGHMLNGEVPSWSVNRIGEAPPPLRKLGAPWDMRGVGSAVDAQARVEPYSINEPIGALGFR